MAKGKPSVTRDDMHYGLRPRNYIDYADTELDDNDEDYSGFMPNNPIKRRNITSFTSTATETVMVNTGVDNIAKHCRGKRGRRSKKTIEIEINKEISEVGQISSMERVPSLWEDSSQGQGSSVQRVSSLWEDSSQKQGSSVKRVSSLWEDSSQKQGSSVKRVSSIHEATSSSKKTILSWLLDCKQIEEDEQVSYKHDHDKEGSATVRVRGRITRGGILCSCCQKEMSVWEFEKHANSDLKKPYDHIYILKTGAYLQELLIAVWLEATERKRREEFSFPPNENQKDVYCLICGNDGDLFRCEHCPSTFHAYCMNMERAPRRDWSCPYCVCKYCCLRLFGKQRQLITCLHCDKNFHWQCFKELSKDPVDISGDILYCSQSCKEIYDKLERSLAVKTVFESYTWSLIRTQTTLAMTKYLECNAKVAVAFTLMNECFQTITDVRTGIDVVQNVLYSCRAPDLTRINFGRFHTFILEKDDAIVCAASIRIHGREVAEIPFIATEGTYRGQGICRKLMTIIESFLCDLKVQKLIIQSVPDTSEMWKHKFGFKELAGKFKKEVASYNILTFPHALKLYKDLNSPTAEQGDKGKQIENQNAEETEEDNAERPFPDLNVDPYEEGYQ